MGKKNNELLIQINDKLGKIIELLTPSHKEVKQETVDTDIYIHAYNLEDDNTIWGLKIANGAKIIASKISIQEIPNYIGKDKAYLTEMNAYITAIHTALYMLGLDLTKQKLKFNFSNSFFLDCLTGITLHDKGNIPFTTHGPTDERFYELLATLEKLPIKVIYQYKPATSIMMIKINASLEEEEKKICSQLAELESSLKTTPSLKSNSEPESGLTSI